MSNHFNHGRSMVLVSAAAIALSSLMLAGCSSGGTSSGQSSSGKSQSLSTMKVGITPVADAGGYYTAEDRGFFKDKDLTVKGQTIAGGAALIPALESGALDIGFSNLVSVLQAREKGLDVKCLAGTLRKPPTGTDLSLMLAPKDSGLVKSAADLEGKTVAVNTIDNINQLVAEAWIDKNGGDSKNVKFVAVAFPDMPAALSGGRVDAAIADEPFVTLSKQAGASVLAPRPYQAIAKAPVFSCWLVTAKWADSHEAEAKAFVSALKSATKYIDQNPDYLRTILPKYTSISKELAEKISLPEITTKLTNADYNVWQNAALKYGLIKKKVNPSEIDAGLNK